VKFPTGGKQQCKPASAKAQIRCDTGADSTVWMKEEMPSFCLQRPRLPSKSVFFGIQNPEALSSGFFMSQTSKNKTDLQEDYHEAL